MPTRRAGGRHGKPWRAAGVTLVVLLAISGTALLTAGLNPAPAQPPQPADTEAAETSPQPGSTPRPPLPPAPGTPTGQPGAPTGPGMPTGGPPPLAELPRSEPVRIGIPKIRVDAEIMPLGVEADGTVQVPPLKQAHRAGWYKLGASPGEFGNAVVVGHVDSAAIGPAVFFRLGSLERGDRIEVVRADGELVRFAVDAVKSYPKTSFPSELVYGTADAARLQVVTCGGSFDRKEGSYRNNVIVSATRIP
ncbi:class F sortase [Micromonospora sp. WMMD1102]|uniref:class F sortase n=1 Tax=Micromonospora sp. WMMD1102 TaxID=3016105 RepID=UPI002414DDF0|nr:class F sortase [Micromonospora sp. WMMD1102]MDG4789539.1 class F sortase [Micromonospora sp. WMMD1102]